MLPGDATGWESPINPPESSETAHLSGAVWLRSAQPEDVPWLWAQLVDFSHHYPARRSLLPADRDAAERKLVGLIMEHVVLLAIKDERPVGFIAGTLAPHWFNPAIQVLSELFWWVPERCRGTRAGALLFNAFVQEGLARADWVVMTLESNSPVRHETLTKRGFRATETNFLLEVRR